MLKEISIVCDNNNINYYLAGGTFLGAIRHKGFIPWDDDIDINLTIKDIKRLKKRCKKLLPSYYFWQDVWTDRNHHMIWTKIRDTRTKISETTTTGERNGGGVYIDIFPMVYAAKWKKLFDIQIKTIFAWSYCVGNQSKIRNHINSSFLVRIYRFVREVTIYRLGGQILYWLMLLLQDKKSERLIVLDVSFFGTISEGNIRRAKRTMIHSDWLSPKLYEFENYQFKSFSDSNSYMIDHFGKDYMIPIKFEENIHINLEKTDINIE